MKRFGSIYMCTYIYIYLYTIFFFNKLIKKENQLALVQTIIIYYFELSIIN